APRRKTRGSGRRGGLPDVRRRGLRDPAGDLGERGHAVSGRRVVVTGRGVLSPLGHDWPVVLAWLKTGRNAVRRFDDWAEYKGLNTLLGVPAQDFALPGHYTRKATRSMGRVSLMATRASE